MTDHLLDASVVIAMAVAEHEHHALVVDWLAGLSPTDRVVLCPIAEGALVRYLVRAGVSAVDAARGCALLRGRPGVSWWPDEVSYAEVDLTAVRGHRQVTDAYLVGLAAAAPDARLVTLDRGLAETWPQALLIS